MEKKKPEAKGASSSENKESTRQIKSAGYFCSQPIREEFWLGARHFFAALLGVTQEKITPPRGKRTPEWSFVFLWGGT